MGTNKVYPDPDKPGESLPFKEVLDPVLHGNYHPDGSKDRAHQAARYIRSMAKEEIDRAKAWGDDAVVKTLKPIMVLTGDKLVEAFGMTWHYKDLPQYSNKEFAETRQKLNPRVHFQTAKPSDFRPYGRVDGHFIRIALQHRKMAKQVTGGGQQVLSPRSQELMASSSSFTSSSSSSPSSSSSVPPIPPQAYAEAANGMLLDSNDWMDHAVMLTERPLAEMKAEMAMAGHLLVSPSRRQDEDAQSWAMSRMHKRGKRGPYHSARQQNASIALHEDSSFGNDEEGGGGGGGGQDERGGRERGHASSYSSSSASSDNPPRKSNTARGRKQIAKAMMEKLHHERAKIKRIKNAREEAKEVRRRERDARRAQDRREMFMEMMQMVSMVLAQQGGDGMPGGGEGGSYYNVPAPGAGSSMAPLASMMQRRGGGRQGGGGDC